jgi:anti-sigma28 factor (negative regulator of flagellin synthesis)
MAASPPSPEGADATRASRVQSLKKEVERGAYRTDSEKVAVAVLKELS